MKLFSLFPFLVLAVFSMLSCGRPPDQAFDKAANAGIKTILLLQIPDGDLVVHTDDAPRPLDTNFREHANLSKEMTNALRAELENRGFKVQVSDFVPRIVSEAGIDTETQYYYDDIETGADAILHAEMKAGYTVAGFPREYRPWLEVGARLLAGSSKKQLYFQRLTYGGPLPGTNHIPSPPEYAFPTVEALLQDRGVAVARLQAGTKVLAAAIAQQLR